MKRSILIVLVVVAACAGGIIGSLITINYAGGSLAYTSIQERQKSQLTNYSTGSSTDVPKELNFLSASRKVTPGVVHIRTSYGSGEFSLNPLQRYLDSPARSSGSGVIVSDDGYIVTNHHVIDEATNIEVVMNNNQHFYAKVIGSDPSTDLALLKIKAKDLPFVRYGDSDKLGPGEWVLAVGNPFDLNSTVTAGIVSAKARNIGILRDRNNLQVEAFIQTDAAVNPGNSGGALVNLQGELVGINTAIATSSGSYQGYSFAIPVSLVRKVMDDLLEFGNVQRGLLGIQIENVTAQISEELGLPVSQGVLVNRVNPESAAQEAGIVAGDVVLAIDGQDITSVSELQELVARKRPGKGISVTFLHEGQRKNVNTLLRNYEGTQEIARRKFNFELKGAELEDIPYKELTKLQLEGGVRIKNIKPGVWKEAGVKTGYIVAYVDKVAVDNVEDLNRILELKSGGVLLEGFYPGGKKSTYGLEW
jgi:serine protease Do